SARRDQIVAVPTSGTDRATVSRRARRTDARGQTRNSGRRRYWVVTDTSADQVGNGWIIAGPLWLHISGSRGTGGSNLLLQVADDNVQCAPSKKISRCIVVARLGKLPVGGSTGEICKA